MIMLCKFVMDINTDNLWHHVILLLLYDMKAHHFTTQPTMKHNLKYTTHIPSFIPSTLQSGT